MLSKDERLENPFDDFAPSNPQPYPEKSGVLGASPLMLLFPAWLYAWTQ